MKKNKLERTVKLKSGNTMKVPCDPSDPRPTEIALEVTRAETQDERIRRIIREQIRPQDHGYETEDDNEDLEVEDDEHFLGELPMTPAEAEYIKSTKGDLIDEYLTPLSSPKTGEEAPEPQPDQAVLESQNPDQQTVDGKEKE